MGFLVVIGACEPEQLTDDVGAIYVPIPATGTYRVVRGGSSGEVASKARAAYRRGDVVPSNTSNYRGFRLVRTLP